MADLEHPTPITIGELGVAFALRNKLEDERNQQIKETLDVLTKKIEDDIKSKADKDYVDDVKKDLEELSKNAVTKTEFRIGLGVITTGLAIFATIIGLWKSLTGK